MLDDAEKKIRESKKHIDNILLVSGNYKRLSERILKKMLKNQDIADVVESRIDDFCKEMKCEVLDDGKYVDVNILFRSYFDGSPPFGGGNKKQEFPDALALNALEIFADEKGISIIVVSSDNDWKKFCSTSEFLYYHDDVSQAIALINDAPEILRERMQEMISGNVELQNELRSQFVEFLERESFTVLANPTSGEVEANAWGSDIGEIDWSNITNLEILRVEESNFWGRELVTVAFFIIIPYEVEIELKFFIWDSVDREYLSIGERYMKVQENAETQIVLSIDVSHDESEGVEFEVDAVEMEASIFHIELDSVDPFEIEEGFSVS